ncbi:MAG: hypothetical protein ABIQ88_21825 [Chitinophagaceae bacterium]
MDDIKIAGSYDTVFINCPFDALYQPMLRAIVFAVYRCGFLPVTALDTDDGTETRLLKIIRLIERCRYGIHDLSRIEQSSGNFPRFNMPFELGIFFGARYLGDKIQRNKNALIFERVKFTYQQYISDLNGIDPKAHNNDPFMAIQLTSDWLRTASGRKTIPGHVVLKTEYQEFDEKLPAIIAKLGFAISDLPLTEYRTIAEAAVREKLV